MGELVLRTAIVVLAIAATAWVVLSVAVLLGRARFDRRARSDGSERPLADREARRLVRRARGNPRTEWGRWRTVTAVMRLARARHASAPGLVRSLLADPDERVAGAAVRVLGEIGDDRAVDMLLASLREGRGARSRIAAELERLAPVPGPLLPPLLRDADPGARFWGVTLLGRYPDIGTSGLIALSWDPDPNVRAAVAEALDGRPAERVGGALLTLLGDREWFVRVHAARAAGHVLGAAAAPSLCALLSEQEWWVRSAAKDALRGIGSDAVPALLSVLVHSDPFARNGAAEILQDIGFVDALVDSEPESSLLQRIYHAGGEGMRAAAEQRATSRARPRRLRAA